MTGTSVTNFMPLVAVVKYECDYHSFEIVENVVWFPVGCSHF